MLACIFGHIDIVRMLVIEFHANVDIQSTVRAIDSETAVVVAEIDTCLVFVFVAIVSLICLLLPCCIWLLLMSCVP